MANEIIGTRKLDPNGRTDAQMLYLFPIDGPVLDSSGEPVVPAFDVARIPAALRSQLDRGQIEALNSSAAGYLITSLTQSAGEDDAAFQTRVLADYAALSAHALQQRRDEANEAAIFNKRRFTISAK